MADKHKLLFIIPAILLIPILLGMTPLNMAHKLANGGPFAHGKQTCLNNHCPFHSIVSQEEPIIINLNLTLLYQESTPEFDLQVSSLDSVHSNLIFHSIPLRC